MNWYESTAPNLYVNSSEETVWMVMHYNDSSGNQYGNTTIIENNFAERLLKIIVPIVFGVIVTVGFIGNLLVIIVIVSNKRMVNTTNILIFSLALADLCFIVFCVPFTAAKYVIPRWPFGRIWCKIMQYLTYVCAYASVYTLVLMSFDRYLAVVHPIRSMTIRTEKNCLIMVIIVWVIILAANTPLLIQFDLLVYVYHGEQRQSCVNTAASEDPMLNIIFYVAFFVAGYVIPLTLVCILYGFMLRRLLFGITPRNQSAESIRSKKRVTRMIVIVVILFAICWLPIQIIFMLHSAGVYAANATNFWIHLIANCFAYANSCMNPILYAFLSDNFRKSFRKLLCCSSPALSTYDYERTQIRGSMSTRKSEAV